MVAEPDTFHSQPATRSAQCESMELADVPEVSNEERNDDLSSNVPAKTPWQCKAEFSTDKMVDDIKNLKARCRWSRKASVPAECQISDGCVGSLCRSQSVCRNKATSTVVVLRTTFVTDSGFELKSTTRDSEICHACENVQDCPGGRRAFQ